jgi:DNA-3-methyladenine glycosylase
MEEILTRPLPRAFYSRPTRAVARDLLGCTLVRRLEGTRLSGRIVEAEAYIGERDLACHARVGKTPRTRVMYGPAGFAYVYFNYGMHWMLNVVTENEEFPAAVLLRAIEPLEGIEAMQRLRGGKELHSLCSGPARLTQALGITGEQNSLDLCQASSEVWVEYGTTSPRQSIARTPRVGIAQTPEPWRSKSWRYLIKGNPFVSK